MSYRIAPGVDVVEAHSGPALLAWNPLRLVTVNAALAKLLRGAGDIVPNPRPRLGPWTRSTAGACWCASRSPSPRTVRSPS